MRSTSFVVASVLLVGSVFGRASAQCVDPLQQSFVAPVGSLYAEGNVLTTHFVAPQAITVSGDRAFVSGREVVMQKTVGVAAEYVRQPNGTWAAGVRIVGSPTINNSPEYFADRLALDGDRLVIGGSKIRNAWIYERTNGVWAQVAHFPEIGSGTRFGAAVAIDADTVVVGAPEAAHPTLGYAQAGVAYVYQRVAGAWIPAGVLASPTPMTGAHFASSIAIDGSTLVIGAPDETVATTGVGALHVFEQQSGTWSATARLTAANPAQHRIAQQIDLDDDTLVSTSDGIGALVFTRSGPFWFQTHQLIPAGSFAPGGAVALLGSRLAVADIGYSQGVLNRGAVHVYERTANDWVPRQMLVTPSAIFGTEFGQTLALGDGGPNQGVLFTKCPNAGNPPNSQPSTVLVYATQPNPLAEYGAGCPGSGAVTPTLDDLLEYDGCFDDGSPVSYRIANGLGGAPCVLLLSAGTANVPLANGCLLLVAPSPLSVVVPLFGVGPGGGSITLNATIPVGTPAASIFMQAFVADLGAPGGFAATNGIRLSVN